MIPPQGMQIGITPYSVKLATALVHVYEPDNLTKDRHSHCFCVGMEQPRDSHIIFADHKL